MKATKKSSKKSKKKSSKNTTKKTIKKVDNNRTEEIPKTIPVSKSKLDMKLNVSKRTVYFVVGILLLLLVAITGYNFLNTPSVQNGDNIAVWYTGRLTNGEVFDTNIREIAEQNEIFRQAYNPLEFMVGSGMMIKGFDQAVLGMRVGDKITVTLKPDEAYGNYKAELVESIPLDDFLAMSDLSYDDLYKGMEIWAIAEGRQVSAVISTIGINFVSLDFNHKLAGQNLIFDIELISIN
jgi:peptidylprolyl isomerase